MKIKEIYLQNFVSYPELLIEFKKGLVLISGPTGSGKSTICDAIPWVLFGKTAKNGLADEVLAWNANEPTKGSVIFDNGLVITRHRGGKEKPDLFYRMHQDGKRGKDLNDTQKQINDILGFDETTYLAGAYFHEFSQVAGFFTANAKTRRMILEQITDLKLAKTVQENLSSYAKEIDNDISILKEKLLQEESGLSEVTSALENIKAQKEEWEVKKIHRIQELQLKSQNFLKEKETTLEELFFQAEMFKQQQEEKMSEIKFQIQECEQKKKPDSYFLEKEQDLTNKRTIMEADRCKECGSPKHSEKIMVLDRELYKLSQQKEENQASVRKLIDLSVLLNKTAARLDPYKNAIKIEKERKNTYEEQIAYLYMQPNPHDVTLATLQMHSAGYDDRRGVLESEFSHNMADKADALLLKEVLEAFRANLMSNIVSFLQQTTNSSLEKYFDGEIRVQLKIEDADNLEVEITKDGNACSYSQLSKGQRQLLKLCFGTAVMKAVSNHHGVTFDCLWFDEALDGMDDSTKVKAFNLLNALSLEYDTIFCIDHAEAFKSMFDTRLEVSITGGVSTIEEA